MKNIRKKILIVEDEDIVARMVAKILADTKASFSTAGTLAEGWGLLQREHFDLVILDRILPDGDGALLFNNIKGAPALKKLPVLILSGRNAPLEQAEGLDLGADDYMTKPFSPEELKARVSTLLRRAGKFV